LVTDARAPDYRTLFEDSFDAVLVIGIDDGRVLDANLRAADLYGCARGDLVGTPVRNLAENPDAAAARFSELRARGAGRFEVRHRHAAGHVITVEVSAARTSFAGRAAIVGVHRDVSDRVRAEQALAESERQMRDLLGNVRMAAVVLDAFGRVSFCNAYLASLTGHAHGALVGQDWFTACVPDDIRDAERRWFIANMRKDTMPLHERMDVLAHDGSVRTIAWNHTVLRDASGRATGTASIGEDVTERARAEHALRESEERYALAAQGSNDGLWDWDLRDDRVYYSERWGEMLGLAPGQLGDRPDEWFERVHPDDGARLRRDIEEHLTGETRLFRSEFRMQHPDGTWRWMLARGVAVRRLDARPHRMAGSLSDVHERRSAEQQLLHDALHDGLTGLPNRMLFLERVGRALLRSRRAGRGCAVLFIDLDRFKLVNDTLGHAVGDALLVEVGARLRAALSPQDTIARPGGDEFLVLLEDIGRPEDALQCADRIRACFARRVRVRGHDLHVGISVGVAIADTRHQAAEDLLREADTAAYRAKAQGRGCQVLFDPAMHARAHAMVQLESGLRRALEDRALAVAYQPIVSIGTGRVEAFEALARWPRVGESPVSPADFIPVAEDSGLIVPLGRFVLEEALWQARSWRERHRELACISVSVNVSARQIQMDDVTGMVAQALDAVGLGGDALTLEVTESVLADEARVHETLRALREMRVRTSIDDFGTGYSSLGLLHRMPIDTLKIDKRFVDELAVAEREQGAICRTIVDLARGFGMRVVAEGVETQAQYDRLREMRCSSAQGYLLGRPLAAPDAARWLEAHLGEQ
jgi:diguanylate cyclase (GGDEF)-like protein/PAS domain S-box-containing protein